MVLVPELTDDGGQAARRDARRGTGETRGRTAGGRVFLKDLGRDKSDNIDEIMLMVLYFYQKYSSTQSHYKL